MTSFEKATIVARGPQWVKNMKQYVYQLSCPAVLLAVSRFSLMYTPFLKNRS